MQQKIYAIRDTKAEVFGTPFYQKTHGEAERTFVRLRNDDKSMISNYPDDYDLYWLGEYNDQNGLITALETPKHMLKAAMLPKPPSASNVQNIGV